jgi:glycosyltransferase involved in cell wall biosynthesis
VVWSFRQTFELPFRDHPIDHPSDRAATTLCRWLSGTPAAILHNSRAGADQHAAMGFATDRALVIPNGFDTARFRPLSPEEKSAARLELGLHRDSNPSALIAGVAGRSHPMKGHANFVRAAALVLRQFPRARFVLIGRGLDAPDHPLRALARDLGAGEAVLFLGEQQNMERWLGALDVVVSSSAHSEAFPNVPGEAMACGVPVAATRIGDSEELVGDTGFTVPPRDPEALAGAIAKLFALPPENRGALGARARQRVVELYSLGLFVNRHLEVYRNVLAGAPA